MNSEGHRANILNSAYIKIGVGYVADRALLDAAVHRLKR